jgi:Delta24-sterol reductase
VYGLKVPDYEQFVKINKQIEAQTKKLGGKKWFYAHSYYEEKDFWQIYDKKWYDRLRATYKATALPDIYQRTRVTNAYAITSKKALYKTILGISTLRVSD